MFNVKLEEPATSSKEKNRWSILLHCNFFKVAFSTFWFKFGATLHHQAERSDSKARHKAPNLT